MTDVYTDRCMKTCAYADESNFQIRSESLLTRDNPVVYPLFQTLFVPSGPSPHICSKALLFPWLRPAGLASKSAFELCDALSRRSVKRTIRVVFDPNLFGETETILLVYRPPDLVR